ncbi:hypothetical protein GE061_005181 [Apolygus lucorum]|uniref:Peptidase S1 domain-containing protein n=1 Tax=Apolygus lucorum TaxID=248454 RepID=A0A6A4IP10_APOLU|nr:hypothetical protein GE061_005181 [Apolygus lucorum]
MIWLSIFYAFTLASSTVGQEDTENPTKADAAGYTWIVAIAGKSRKSDVFICTGAVITMKQILTSAWCIEQMPGEISLFTPQAVETFTRPPNVSEEEESLLDYRNVVGCYSNKFFHPCYSRVQQCTNARCNRLSWQYDLAIVETQEEMKEGVTIMDMNFVDFNEDEVKECIFVGFDYARMYAENKDSDHFFLVQSKMAVSRGNLPCKLREALKDGVIWSEKRFDGFYRFLAIAGGYLVCGSQVAGVFLGKIDVEACTVENHHDSTSTRKFWASWTYLMLHKPFIDAVVAGDVTAPPMTDHASLAAPPICMILITLVLSIDFKKL